MQTGEMRLHSEEAVPHLAVTSPHLLLLQPLRMWGVFPLGYVPESLRECRMSAPPLL